MLVEARLSLVVKTDHVGYEGCSRPRQMRPGMQHPFNSRHLLRFALVVTAILAGATPVWADLKAGRTAFAAGDYATALTEFTRAADAGDMSAQYLAGEMLLQGRGIARDVPRGLSYVEQAARGGHVGAQSVAGALYAFGQDMPADYAKALAYLRPAAAAGDMHAQNNLATLLYFGLGTGKDLVDALHWAKRAAAKRLVAAIRLSGEIEAQATPDQISAATRRAAQPLAPVTSTITAGNQQRHSGPPPPPPAAPVATPTPPAPVTKPVAAAPVPAATVPVTRPLPPPTSSPPPPPPPTPPATPPTKANGDGWVIQVGALPSASEAQSHWKSLSAKQSALLAGLQPTMVQADLGAKGIYTRVFLTGFADKETAQALCTKLKSAGSDCLVKKGP